MQRFRHRLQSLPCDLALQPECLLPAAIQHQQVVERGLLPLGEHGAAFEQRIRRDRARWAQVVQANGIRGD